MVDHKLGVGADIHTYCTRCKADRWHVIVAKLGAGAAEHIKRVECKTCGSTHNLRDSQTTRAHKKTIPKKKARRATVAASEPAQGWQQIVNEREAAGEEHKSYNIKAVFGVGNLIDHPKFGIGVVLKLLDNDQKAEIQFQEGVKLLIMNRGG